MCITSLLQLLISDTIMYNLQVTAMQTTAGEHMQGSKLCANLIVPSAVVLLHIPKHVLLGLRAMQWLHVDKAHHSHDVAGLHAS